MRCRNGTRVSRVATALLTMGLVGLAVLATGCVERRYVQVPVYYPAQPAVAPAPASSGAPAIQPAAPPGSVIVTQAGPPPARVEIVPLVPGPDYVWAPGYWGWQGGWVWMSGSWVIRPRPGVIWVGGHWARHRRGLVWVGGYWR
ncbi:MAG: hypothetical protein ACYDH9_00665 [Limisphaerales bacterium]